MSIVAMQCNMDCDILRTGAEAMYLITDYTEKASQTQSYLS